MRRPFKIRHEFVEFIPKGREWGVLYVSIPYATAVHSCFCGCGIKVVTPISPVGWQLIYDGETVSLFPSIGSWAFPCRSHYFIKRDTVVWAGSMSEDEVAWGRARDRAARETHFDGQPGLASEAMDEAAKSKRKKDFWSWLGGRR
ncbi:DUF6527 family protein [Caulobacter sp. KR2-114]|uniref:DUF6527 family protein n=1 Tax=Caulobacter sp. KR2-114 TaxID=3400912 RepID=UPI003BFE9487